MSTPAQPLTNSDAARRERIAAATYLAWHQKQFADRNIKPWIELADIYREQWYEFVDVTLQAISDETKAMLQKPGPEDPHPAP